MARNMKNAHAGKNVVAQSRARDVGTIGKLADRPHEGIAVDSRLPRSEIVRRPFDDVCEVELSKRAEANAPFSARTGHHRPDVEMIFSETSLK
jgi:hypothetical protein